MQKETKWKEKGSGNIRKRKHRCKNAKIKKKEEFKTDASHCKK